jgi:hypothetical protein
MALPSGTFSSTSSGYLQMVFSGDWRVNSADWGSGTSEIQLRCIADNGTLRKTAVIGVKSASALIEMDYAAGSSVAVSMEVISHDIDGAGTVAAQNLRIRCYLIKR